MNRLYALLLAAGLLAWPSLAYASCKTHTYTLEDGRYVWCTTCCYGGHCTTSCH
jgi:hypothetical protein